MYIRQFFKKISNKKGNTGTDMLIMVFVIVFMACGLFLMKDLIIESMGGTPAQYSSSKATSINTNNNNNTNVNINGNNNNVTINNYNK